jgi:hypothetical protein
LQFELIEAESVPNIHSYATADNYISGGIDDMGTNFKDIYHFADNEFALVGELQYSVYGHQMCRYGKYLVVVGGRNECNNN